MEVKVPKTFACEEDESGCNATCSFTDEGHTLGNVLSVPHPAESLMKIRVQTSGDRALDSVEQGLEDIVKLCNSLLDALQ